MKTHLLLLALTLVIRLGAQPSDNPLAGSQSWMVTTVTTGQHNAPLFGRTDFTGTAFHFLDEEYLAIENELGYHVVPYTMRGDVLVYGATQLKLRAAGAETVLAEFIDSYSQRHLTLHLSPTASTAPAYLAGELDEWRNTSPFQGLETNGVYQLKGDWTFPQVGILRFYPDGRLLASHHAPDPAHVFGLDALVYKQDWQLDMVDGELVVLDTAFHRTTQNINFIKRTVYALQGDTLITSTTTLDAAGNTKEGSPKMETYTFYPAPLTHWLPKTEEPAHSDDFPVAIPGGGEIYSGQLIEAPRFPGCEEEQDAEKRGQCAQMKLLNFIYKDFKYPAAAREAGIEGTSVVTFVVERNGTLTNMGLLRDLNPFLDDAALNAARLMIDPALRWVPGKVDERPVRFQFNLPLKFKLE